jgi:hypothetical protein
MVMVKGMGRNLKSTTEPIEAIKKYFTPLKIQPLILEKRPLVFLEEDLFLLGWALRTGSLELLALFFLGVLGIESVFAKLQIERLRCKKNKIGKPWADTKGLVVRR